MFLSLAAFSTLDHLRGGFQTLERLFIGSWNHPDSHCFSTRDHVIIINLLLVSSWF